MYNKYFINICTFIISITITILIQQIVIKLININQNNNVPYIEEIAQNVVINQIQEKVSNENVIQERSMPDNQVNTKIESKNAKEVWRLMIPKIDLIAPISEGTEQTTINMSIGHFEETSIWEGNVGLAAHNRGINAGFFENIKNLVKNDIIIYEKGNNTKQYQVTIITIIQDNDWSYLQPTSNNRITLITCVKNQPEYRLCVQAEEI